MFGFENLVYWGLKWCWGIMEKWIFIAVIYNCKDIVLLESSLEACGKKIG